ncbi:MAG: glycosyltransferase [Desulfamplus sp.]|nr:glycosyltransferase [Desulfamplus sp.]
MAHEDQCCLSIIIPTYNRSRLLKKVLHSLENQDMDTQDMARAFEVLVVDDGSNDDTASMVERFLETSTLSVRYYFQENKKQGAARNLAVGNSDARFLLFIGDDIVPDRGFIKSHLDFHARLDNPEKSCVIGYTTWPGDIPVTPFMEYVGEFGHQFGYSLIDGNGPLPFNFYYTSNLLVPRSALNLLESWFDEDFDVYGWEDIELGFRLEKEGVKLYYNPDALARHYHAMDVLSFCSRQMNVGRASSIFMKKHPELKWFLGDEHQLIENAGPYLKACIQKYFVHFMDKWLRLPLSHGRYRFILDTHYARAALDHKT